MNRNKIINIVNICLLILGILFMFITDFQEILFLGIGYFVSSALNLLFNNIGRGD